jgi:diaminopimelate epimerase
MRNRFFKGHGLGNDYLVVDPRDLDFRLGRRAIRAICDRHRGVGGDGILAVARSRRADFGVRIFNPDGSEAEKSGNGLRIFARYLHATGRVRTRRFAVETRGGVVAIELHLGRSGEADEVTVEMGRASFRPAALPCRLRVAELVDQPIRAAGRWLRFTGVSVGNPHCVVFRRDLREWSRSDLLELGPALETHAIFPRRTNVQLARTTGPRSLSILVWERGAGETEASGSSACAVAAAAVRLGRVRSPVAVRAPGGVVRIEVGSDFEIRMRGAVSEVARGALSEPFVRALRRIP